MVIRILFLLSIFCFSFQSSEAESFISEEEKVCQSIAPEELATYHRLIKQFGGTVPMSETVEQSEIGLQSYLDEAGVRNFTASEIIIPHNEQVAEQCGITNLLPPSCIWANGAAILSIFERIREQINGRILVRNWWRSICYNTAAEGAKASDHLLAKSFDIDFSTAHDRAVAQKYICEKLWKKQENVQIGIGCKSLHVGLGSPFGKRYWIYSSMDNCSVKNKDSCWKM